MEINSTTKFCSNCGRELPPNAKLCPWCNPSNNLTISQDASVRGTAITGLVFTLSIVLSFVGFILSIVSVIKGACLKAKVKPGKVKGFSIAIISLILSAIMVATPIVIITGTPSKIEKLVNEIGIGQKIDYSLIDDTVTALDAGEYDKALTKISSMDDATRSKGYEKIHSSLVSQVSKYKNTSSWCTNTYSLVDTSVIGKLETLEKINTLLPTAETSSNIGDFLDKALKLKEFSKWNKYYSIDDSYLADAKNYLDQGAVYRKTSPSITETYYEKAYQVTQNAVSRFSGDNSSGMREAYEFYNAFGKQIREIIDDVDYISDYDYETKNSAYKSMIEEYMSDLEAAMAIMDSMPSSIY